ARGGALLSRLTCAEHPGHGHGAGDRAADRALARRVVVAHLGAGDRPRIHPVAAARRIQRKSAGHLHVVDDVPQVHRQMRVTLTGQGYEVDDAQSGDAALEKLRAARFDLVLLDMNMPGMAGLETCRAIRSQSDIGIIMLTVRDTEADKVEA